MFAGQLLVTLFLVKNLTEFSRGYVKTTFGTLMSDSRKSTKFLMAEENHIRKHNPLVGLENSTGVGILHRYGECYLQTHEIRGRREGGFQSVVKHFLQYFWCNVEFLCEPSDPNEAISIPIKNIFLFFFFKKMKEGAFVQ